MRVPFRNLAQYGVIDEVPDHATPLNAWTEAENVTFRDGHVQKARGYTPLSSGDDGVQPLKNRPQFLMPYFDPDQTKLHWIYPGVNDSDKGVIGSFDGAINTDRTNTAGYPGTNFYGDTVKWNGAVVNGVAVVNNQLTVPQVWGRTGATLDSTFSDLDNWAASFTGTGTCKVIRGFRNFFIALDVSDSSGTPTRNPYELRHSGIVDPYTPPEWLPTVSNRAGSKYIGEGGGILIDCLPMRGVLIVYSETEAWPVTFVGGNEVFAVGDKALLEYGMLTSGCVAAFGAGKHFVVSTGDIIVHDGANAESIIDSRRRDALFEEIDTDNYTNCFVTSHYDQGEIWFCYPTIGNTYPNKIAKWNIKSGSWSFQTLPVAISSIRYGAVPEAGTNVVWNSASTVWDDETRLWDEGNYNPAVRNLMMAEYGSTIATSALVRGDETNQFDGSNMTVRLQKTGIAVSGMGQNGPVVDPSVDKYFDEIWPLIKGGPVDIRIGTAQTIDGPYTWDPKQSFDPATMRKLDFRPYDGKYAAVEFSSEADVGWQLDGYDLNVQETGKRA